MSLPREKIGVSDAVVDENISSPDDNDDTSASAEIYEAARKLEDMEESKKLPGSASDADVSSFSSSDSTQTVIDADIARKSGIGSKLQRSPKQNFKRMKFDEEYQVKLEDDESSDEKDSKLCVKKDKKSPRKPKCEAKEVTDSAAGCSSGHGKILKTGSKRTRLDSDKQMDCRYHSSGEFVTKSVQEIQCSSSNIAGKPSEVCLKKGISKKSPEKFQKTRLRLGSSEIAAVVIEDAIDHTDESVFSSVGSSDFITADVSNSIHNTGIVTDITDDAVDHTDQAVFGKVSSSNPVVVDTIRNAGIVTDVQEDSIDPTDEAGLIEVKSANIIAAVVSNILHEEASPQPQICSEDKERTVQEESDSRKLDFQEVKADEVVSATVSNIFSQVSQIEGGNISDRITDPYNLQDIDKTESSCESNQSDQRMEFSSGSTIPSGFGYNTDTEKMDCSNDTYSGFEGFKIESESNTSFEKMECKSQSSTSRDKMETESFSVKSTETEGMEYSSESMTNFEENSISIHENESISVLENEHISVLENEHISVLEIESTSVQENEFISLQENESINVHEKESIGVQEIKPISVQENESINVQENESINVRENESINVQEDESIGVQEDESISIQEDESINAQENESTGIKENESISVQENESINIVQREDASIEILESISCRIGDFISRAMQESVSCQPYESVSHLDQDTVSHALTDNKFTHSNESDSNSNEIKAIYESNIDTNVGIERKFTMPRKETSDTNEYEVEQKQVSDKEVVDKELASRGEPSSKRRRSSDDKKFEETAMSVEKTTDDQKQSAANLPDKDSDELKDGDEVDRKGNKKLKQ